MDAVARGLAAKALARGSTIDTVITRLQRSIARPGNRRLSAQPWNAPPAWPASTTVPTGFRCVNGGNVYGVTTNGTTASTGGPTGTGAGPITDGTVTWYYVGPAYSSDASAPTVSSSTSTPTLAKVYVSPSSNSTGPWTTAPPAVRVSNDSWYTRQGNYGGSFQGGAATGRGGYEFMTDAQQIVVAQACVSAASGYGLTVEVDGRYLVDGTLIQPATTGWGYYTITFPDRRPRRIALWFQTAGAPTCPAVYCDAFGTIWKPAAREGGLRGMFIGDSYSVSSGFFGEGNDKGIAAHAMNEVGIDNVLIDGFSGTGWGVGSPPYEDITRTPRMTTWQPDILMVMAASVNNDASSQSAVNTAMATWLAAARAAVPNAWIFMLGRLGRTAAGETTLESYVRQFVAGAGDSKLVFIPVSGDPAGAWATGTGTVSAPSGSGNGDLYWGADNIHPVQRGQEYLGRRVGQAVKAWAATQ